MNEKQKIKKELEMARNAVKEAGLFLVSKKEIDKLTEVAVDAYQDYPLHNWLSGGKYNPMLSKLLMKVSLKTMLDIGVIYADSPELNGFTIWMPPKFDGSKVLPFLLKGGFILILNFGFKFIKKLMDYETYAMGLKQKFTGNLDWYFFNLCVKKDAQGKGISTKLVKPMLEFLSKQNSVCYLETNKDTNVPIYEHFGFKLMEKGFIPETDVMHFAMVKQPENNQ